MDQKEPRLSRLIEVMNEKGFYTWKRNDEYVVFKKRENEHLIYSPFKIKDLNEMSEERFEKFIK